MHVFVYGSLLNPMSLGTTLPGADLAQAVPGACGGYRRSFEVAFPNDGTQPDKAYVDTRGRRPPYVLLAQLSPVLDSHANGVCLPVDDVELAALRRRERRYRLVDLTERFRPYPGVGPRVDQVVGFVGAARFTRAADVGRGVLSRRYVEVIEAGATYWERRCPGFAADFASTTTFPSPERIQPLTRLAVQEPGERRGSASRHPVGPS